MTWSQSGAIASAALVVASPITVIPAALPDFRPLNESSNTIHSSGVALKRAAAFK